MFITLILEGDDIGVIVVVHVVDTDGPLMGRALILLFPHGSQVQMVIVWSAITVALCVVIDPVALNLPLGAVRA